MFREDTNHGMVSGDTYHGMMFREDTNHGGQDDVS